MVAGNDADLPSGNVADRLTDRRRLSARSLRLATQIGVAGHDAWLLDHQRIVHFAVCPVPVAGCE